VGNTATFGDSETTSGFGQAGATATGCRCARYQISSSVGQLAFETKPSEEKETPNKKKRLVE